MAKKAEIIVPEWLGNVKPRVYKNRRDFYDSVGLKWVVNEPHFQTMEQLRIFYIVEQEKGKNSFTVLGLSELGKQMLELKEELKQFGSRIIINN